MPHSLMYHGGKGGANGKWIVSQLPPVIPGQLYAETHAGMLGPLLKRPIADDEMVTDLNPRITNWWVTVRDRGDELAEKLAWTPYSEQLFKEYAVSLDEGDEMMRAIKLSVVLSMGMMHGDGGKVEQDFIRLWSGRGVTRTRNAWNRLREVRDRVENVQVFNIPAVDLLRKIADKSHAVVYVDPPYRSADTSYYNVDQQDYEETIEALQAQKGRVAVSGYNDEWDELGWRRAERTVALHAGNKSNNRSRRRTEVLWMNYPAPSQPSLM